MLMETSSSASSVKNIENVFVKERHTVSITAPAVPTTIKGILTPFLSLSVPKSGSMNSANTLSRAIMGPDMPSLMP